MKNTINYLRTHRKSTNITQYDIVALMKLKDNSIVSRCENGNRSPSLEMILVYHLLFDIPVLSLFSNHVDIVKEQLLAGIPKLISKIEKQPISTHVESRIGFLKNVFTRINNKQSHEK